MVEYAFNSVVRGIFDGVSPTSSRLNEECFGEFPLTLLHKDPTVEPRLSELVFLLIIRLVIINCISLNPFISLSFFITLFQICVKLGQGIRRFIHSEIIQWLDQRWFLFAHLFLILVNLRILIFFVVRHL
jgi:hypothetical protein